MSLLIYTGCIFLTTATFTWLGWLTTNWLIQWHRKYDRIQQQTKDKFWNKKMIITNDRAIKNEDYWDAIVRFHSGSLTPEEESRYYFAGIVAESKHRKSDSTLLPLSEEFTEIRSMPVEKIDRRLMIAIGINVIAIGGLPEDSADVG